jgi:hypothetical protein
MHGWIYTDRGGFFTHPFKGHLERTIRPCTTAWKVLLCNREGPICEDRTVEINVVLPVF